MRMEKAACIRADYIWWTSGEATSCAGFFHIGYLTAQILSPSRCQASGHTSTWEMLINISWKGAVSQVLCTVLHYIMLTCWCMFRCVQHEEAVEMIYHDILYFTVH